MENDSTSSIASTAIEAGGKLTVTPTDRISSISAADWNHCSGADNPFISHGFLNALETSGSASRQTGWQPHHLVLRDTAGQIRAVMPMYLKSHSYGEYVFDHSWAHAWQQAGGAYYPKAQAAVPFTPVPGPRLLVAEDAPAGTFEELANAACQFAESLGLSSLHITFLQQDEVQKLDGLGAMSSGERWIHRLGLQFHWFNEGYADWDAFLDQLASRKRKMLRRERRAVRDAGIRFQQLRGAELKSHHWDQFYAFYLATIDRKWGGAYLTREFFEEIHHHMSERILLILAEQDGEVIAGALNFIGADTLYGRNWGCSRDIPFLHFETCYYQAIDAATEMGLKRVEAGAQGMHKVQRGYIPALTHSMHYIPHSGFARAVRDFTRREAAAIYEEAEALAQYTPYRKPD